MFFPPEIIAEFQNIDFLDRFSYPLIPLTNFFYTLHCRGIHFKVCFQCRISLKMRFYHIIFFPWIVFFLVVLMDWREEGRIRRGMWKWWSWDNADKVGKVKLSEDIFATEKSIYNISFNGQDKDFLKPSTGLFYIGKKWIDKIKKAIKAIEGVSYCSGLYFFWLRYWYKWKFAHWMMSIFYLKDYNVIIIYIEIN